MNSNDSFGMNSVIEFGRQGVVESFGRFLADGLRK